MRLTLLLLLASMAAGSDQPECGLDCFHGDVCVPGVADFSGHPTKQNGDVLDIHVEVERHGYHCACHPGYTGLRCGLKYEDCADIDHKCYNGGTCLLGLSDIYGNDQLFCDCSGAVDENGVKYVGKYCEIPKTETCDAEGEFFCVNSGYCKTDYGNYPRRPCHCGPLHDGPHCEFEKDAMPECTLECHNKGACRLGIKQISPGSEEFAYDFWKEHSDYQYCECPEGFHGLQCEVASNKCGQHHCFHGGECITVTEGTKHKHHCDCTRAHSKDSSYGGVYCQYESDNFCDKEKTENGQLYCVNDGVCHEAGSHLGCECPPGFHGPICEFKDADQAVDYEQCALTCDNGGQCRKGVKDTSFLEKFGKELSHLNATHDSNFEHCVCPKGFIGLTCEHSLERCTSGEHVCLHGSTCAQDEDACDCEAGSTISEKLAGKFCEHASTSICTEGTSTSSFSFCVNNGECVDVIMEDNEEHSGCDCSEAFFGPHCEFLKSDASQGHVSDPVIDDQDNQQDDFPEEFIPDDTEKVIPDDIEKVGARAPGGGTTNNTDSRGHLVGGLVGIALATAVCSVAVALLLRMRNDKRKARDIEQALREAEEENERSQMMIVVSKPKTKTRRYRDFLANPDIPDMDGPIRSSSSYHDQVFDNVELL